MRFILPLVLLFAFGSHAEEPSPTSAPAPTPAPSAEPSKLEAMFERLENAFRVQGIVEFPEYSFYLGAPAIQGVAYVPDFHTRIGPKIFYKEYSLTFTLPLPIPDVEERRRGNTDQTEVLLNSYWRDTAFDAYFLRIRGFYIASPWVELSAHKPERYPQVPEAVVSTFGFNYYFVFNPERYSLKAGFDQTEFQKESGGSLILSPFYNHLEMSLGTRFIPGIGDDRVTSMPKLASGRFETVGASIGYGYAYIWGRLFGSSVLAIGNGVQYQKLGRSEDKNVENVTVALKINWNAALGFNAKSWVGGVKFILDSLSSNVSGTEVASNLVSGQVFLGARF